MEVTTGPLRVLYPASPPLACIATSTRHAGREREGDLCLSHESTIVHDPSRNERTDTDDSGDSWISATKALPSTSQLMSLPEKGENV